MLARFLIYFFFNHNNQCPNFIQNISRNGEEAVILTAADMLQTVVLPWKTDFTHDNIHCFTFLKCQALFSHSPKESYTPDTYVKNHCSSLSRVFKVKCCQMFFTAYWVQVVLTICGAIHWNVATHRWPHPQRKMTIPPQQSSAANNPSARSGAGRKSK